MRRPGACARLAAVLVAAAGSLLLAPVASAAPCTVRGDIGAYWTSIGGDGSFLGPCRGDESAVAGGVVQPFAYGSVYWGPSTGARDVHGDIGSRYHGLGGPSSFLRLPVTHETATPVKAGAYNHFVGGSVYWSSSTGAFEVGGSIRDRWASMGWENSFLGFPTTGEYSVPGGRRSDFQGGSVVWSNGTGPQVVHGSIRLRWASLGAESGFLGLPTTSETATPVKVGAYNHFVGGSVYWSPSTGAFEVGGTIRERWASMGWENSFLGFPTTGEYSVPGGRRSDFQGGSLVWDARTGATAVHAGPVPAFTYSVQGVTAADLPSSYRAGCPVPPDALRLLRMSHIGFDGTTRSGELVVHADQVTPVLRSFARLYEGRFPIERMQRVDVYGGSDDASMAANNTSAFNCRRSTGGSSWSEHAFGRSVDINPVQNPYVSGTTVLPDRGRAYLDRSNARPGMVLAGDQVVRALADNGWRWGGYWTLPRDYQHFSVSGR